MQSYAIYANHSRVGMFIFDIGTNGAYTDAHRTDEDEGIVVVPLFAYFSAGNNLCMESTLERQDNSFAGFTDLDNCYFWHFSISMGLC